MSDLLINSEFGSVEVARALVAARAVPQALVDSLAARASGGALGSEPSGDSSASG